MIYYETVCFLRPNTLFNHNSLEIPRMKLSIENASTSTKQKMRAEAKTLRRTQTTVGDGERERCLNHLLDGFVSKTRYGYFLHNEILEKVAQDFPELVIEV